MIQQVVPTEALLITPTALEFGNVTVGTTSSAQVVTVTNVSSAPLVISMAGGAPGAPFNAVQNCQSQTLAAGASCQLTITFAPTTAGVATGTSAGTVNGQSFSVALRGTGVGADLLVTPTSLEFGEVQAGTTSAQQTVTVRNEGAEAVVISMAGGAPGGVFNAVQNCQGQTLAPGATCPLAYTFAPTGTGVQTGTSSGTLNGVPFTVQLRGTGIPAGSPPTVPLLITPIGLDFGNVQIGSTSAQQTVTITNVSGAPIVMSGTGGAPGGAFVATQSCQGQTLAPTASCQMTITFSPAAAGEQAGTSSGTWNGQAFSIQLRGVVVGPELLITPTGLDFGEVEVGTTSAPQAVTVTNLSGAPMVMSGTGGAPTGPFTGVQSCQGNTVAAGASCQMTFRFATTSSGPQTGTASGAWNDVPFSIALTGRGIGEDQGGGTIDGRVEFLPPLGKRPRVKAGSTLTVRFRLLDEDGVRISRAEAQALDQSCALRITFSGGNADPGCTRYQNGRVFRLQLKTSRALAPGTYTVGVQLASNGSSETVGAVEIVIF